MKKKTLRTIIYSLLILLPIVMFLVKAYLHLSVVINAILLVSSIFLCLKKKKFLWFLFLGHCVISLCFYAVRPLEEPHVIILITFLNILLTFVGFITTKSKNAVFCVLLCIFVAFFSVGYLYYINAAFSEETKIEEVIVTEKKESGARFSFDYEIGVKSEDYGELSITLYSKSTFDSMRIGDRITIFTRKGPFVSFYWY